MKNFHCSQGVHGEWQLSWSPRLYLHFTAKVSDSAAQSLAAFWKLMASQNSAYEKDDTGGVDGCLVFCNTWATLKERGEIKP